MNKLTADKICKIGTVPVGALVKLPHGEIVQARKVQRSGDVVTLTTTEGVAISAPRTQRVRVIVSAS